MRNALIPLGMLILSSGCGGTNNCAPSTVQEASGHSHTAAFTITDDQISAGSEVTYSAGLSEASSHTHDVTLVESDFQSLQKPENIDVTSSSNSSHTHTVDITCSN